MSFVTNSLILLVFLYISTILYIRTSDVELPEWMSITAGVLILVRTKRGIPQIKKISNSTDRWDTWGNLGVIFALFVMSGAFLFVLYSLFLLVTTQSDPTITDPKNYLVIPGVNDFIPLTVIAEVLIALLFAMVIHELGHAIYCVYEDIGIESTGLVLFGIIPIGAFVEPNEDGQEAASRPSRLRMFSAGVFNNLWTTIITLGLLLVITSSLIAPVGGAYIASSENPNLERGDVIKQVNGVQVDTNQNFLSVLEDSEGGTAQISLANGENLTIDKELYISSVLEDSDLQSGSKITAINGKSVSSISEIRDIVYSLPSSEIIITTENGQTTEYKTGATYITSGAITVSDKEIPRNSLLRITSHNNSIVHSSDQIEELSDGDEITFVYNDTEYEYVISEKITESVVSVNGINGLEFNQLNVSLFEGQFFYEIVSGDAVGSVGVSLWIAILFFAPFASLIGLENNFPGFTSDISNFYSITEPGLSVAEPGIMFLLTILYWSFWLNCNLFIFNCLPTYALDGGHILRDSIQLGNQKIGFDPEIANLAISTILITTIVALLLMIGYSTI